MSSFVFTFFYLFYVNLSQAVVLKIPELTSGVMDEARFFNSLEKEKLNQQIYNLFDGGGPQMAILTVENLQGLSIEEFSIKVAEKWKLGTKEKDNGLLLVITKSERLVRLEVGNGIEGEITDYEANYYTNNVLPKYFKQGQFYYGIEELIETISKKFNVSYLREGNNNFQTKNTSVFFNTIVQFLLPLIFVILVLAGSFYPKKPFKRGLFSGLLISLICIPLSLTLFWYLILFLMGLFAGAVNFGHLFLMALRHKHNGYSGYGSRGGGFGGGFGGGSSGGWSGGGGGFSGGGSSGKW